MMRRASALVILIFFLVFFWAGISLSQEAEKQAETIEERIIPSPKDVKEKTAIYVFVGWMWLSIIVLFFVLRAKIKEVDRLYHIRFYSDEKE